MSQDSNYVSVIPERTDLPSVVEVLRAARLLAAGDPRKDDLNEMWRRAGLVAAAIKAHDEAVAATPLVSREGDTTLPDEVRGLNGKHQYMVFVDHGGPPKFKHSTIGEAVAEAKRLANKTGRVAMLVKFKGAFKPHLPREAQVSTPTSPTDAKASEPGVAPLSTKDE